MASLGTEFCRLALEEAGLSVLEIKTSAVDARDWDDDANRALVARLIEERARPA